MSTKAEDTQKNILDTARKHFLRDGLTGASLRNIVKDAGLTTGAFYKYYPTKESLFDALTDPYMEHIYDHYDNFRLLLKCGDSGKFELFIHHMVDREMKSSMKYMEKMKEAGVKIPVVEESLMHMIYTGFFSSVFQIIEHDIDKETAKKNVNQLREFQTGGWERLWNIKFPAEDK